MQLLVNQTLYEKTLASGFGSIHFLLDASEQQQVMEFSFVLNNFVGIQTLIPLHRYPNFIS